MTTSPVIFILIVLSVVLGFEALAAFVRLRAGGDQQRVRRRLRALAATLQASDDDEDVSLLRGDKSGQTTLDVWIDRIPLARQIALKLYRAGLTFSVKRFLVISAGFSVIGAFGAAAFLPFSYAHLIGLGAGALPYLHVERLGRKRRDAFEKQFPDALDLLIRALRAGHSFSTGLQMVGEELPEPVGREFSLVADEIQLGKDVCSALENLVYRVDAPDLPFFVVAVTMQRETGSNLAEVLHNLSDVIRERFKLYGKVRSLTAMGRASANMLAVWPLIMVAALYSANPDYIRPLWETESGHTMMLISAVMIAVGYVLCRKMATIKV
jgi:tight adherence protein B